MFKDELKKTIDDLGMTQKAFAYKVGCSNAAISQYLSGKHEPTADKKRDMAERLGLPFTHFDSEKQKNRVDATEKTNRNLSVEEVADLLGKSPKWVRTGLIEGRLDFGYAVKLNRWSFCIPKEMFEAKTGMVVDGI